MATLKVWSFLYCLTEIEGVTWRPQDYTTMKIKKAVKGEEIKGYFEIRVGNQTKRFDNNNRDTFMPLLYNAIAAKLSTLIRGEFQIIPIPNKSALAKNSDDFLTWTHAKGIAARLSGKAEAIDALRWKYAMQQAHKTGGFRDPQLYFENLVVTKKPTKPIVLFDDLITSGSQMIACTRRLAEVGVKPVIGIVVGHATKEQPENMIGWQESTVVIEEDPVDWDSF